VYVDKRKQKMELYVLLNRKFLRKKILSFFKEEKVYVDKRKQKMELKLLTWPIFEETRIKRKEKMQWKLGYVNFLRLDLNVYKKCIL
jgi:hypothetical protein